MSGHSKWATIKRKKSKIDGERGKIFTKLSKEIIVAVRQGGADPDGNFRLKLCIQNAKANNMPNDNIQRSIQKAAGMTESEVFEEIYYEGYGPAGVAILCLIMTDNRNRTASEVRYIFSRNGGNLGETGCVAWMFDRKGQLLIDSGDMNEADAERLFMTALEAGADDITNEDGEAEVIVAPESLEAVREAVIAAGFDVKQADIVMLPQNTIEIDDLEQAETILSLIEKLEDNDDVRAVYANFNIPDEIMMKL